MAALGALCVCLIGFGLFAWDRWLREHTSYYSNFIKRWGIPQGIAKSLSDEQVRHRAVSLKVVSKAGKVTRVDAVDSHGQCTPYNNVGTYLDNSYSVANPLH